MEAKKILGKSMPTANPKRGRLFIGLGAFGLFGIFFLMGVHALYFGHFVAQRNVAASQGWVETRCEILEAGVNVYTDPDHGAAYTIYVTFKYEFDRQEYISDRYDFSFSAHSDETVPQAVVFNLSPGTQTVCYVNPDDPSEAVVKREGDDTGTLWGASAVITLGLVGMFLTLIIGMEKNPVEMIGDTVFLIVDKMLDKMDPPADPEPKGADLSDPADDVADIAARESDTALAAPEAASWEDPNECFAEIPASRVVELLRAHGEVRSQGPLEWNGDIPLPQHLATFYREVGPIDITIEGFGVSTLIPSLSKLWEHQARFRGSTTDGLLNRIRRRLFHRWDNDWIVVAIEDGDLFIYSVREEKILYTRQSRGTYEPHEVYPDLNTMAACMAILGTVAVNAGEDLFDDEFQIRPTHMSQAIAQISKEIGDESKAAAIVAAAGWA